jgi:hypothetical protein
LATIEIFDPEINDGTYNAATNTFSSSRTVLWTGKARIQAVRSSSARANQMNPTSIQELEVHIDMRGNPLEGSEGTMPDIRPQHQIFITSSPYDETLENYILTVRSALTTSNPWGKMLHCEVDQEVKRVSSP